MDLPSFNEITKKIKQLPDNLQRQVLIFVDALQVSSTRGTPGKLLLELQAQFRRMTFLNGASDRIGM